MNVYFTSDTHFSHANICGPAVSEWDKGYRDFSSVQEMNDCIVESINSKVQPNDVLYHLGDWSFGGKDQILKFRNLLKVKTIHLIYGNHDKNIRLHYRDLFSSCRDVLETHINGQRFFMSHYAHRIWNKSHHGSIHLYGHSHHTLPEGHDKSMDVGWCKYRSPLSFNEIMDIMSSRPIGYIDHHNAKTAE